MVDIYRPHWEYFLSIESDLIKCSRFIEFNKQNFTTYSIELAKIILTAGAEIDNILKLSCNIIDKSCKATKINEYSPIITSSFPGFTKIKIFSGRFKIELTPWEDWNSSHAPDWWKHGYNKVKHDREKYYENANLYNALNAVGGLMLALILYYKTVNEKLVLAKSQSQVLFDEIYSDELKIDHLFWS